MSIIIDLCGGTGAWSRPYLEAGYEVHIVTKPHDDVFTWDLYKEMENVVGILAAPTCTQFSLARTTAKTPRDLEGGFELVHRCLEIIWYCRFHKGLKFWALENPMGYLRQIIGKPVLTFDPCDYGAKHTKKTDIWGYFNLPKQKPYNMTEEDVRRSRVNNRYLPELPDDYILPDDFNTQAARRSITDEHFAEAFFKANNPLKYKAIV